MNHVLPHIELEKQDLEHFTSYRAGDIKPPKNSVKKYDILKDATEKEIFLRASNKKSRFISTRYHRLFRYVYITKRCINLTIRIQKPQTNAIFAGYRETKTNAI